MFNISVDSIKTTVILHYNTTSLQHRGATLITQEAGMMYRAAPQQRGAGNDNRLE
jgi:hypothetical protein